MAIRILNGEAVRAALPMRHAIDAVRSAYVACSSGTGIAPDRVHIDLPGDGNVALFMPGLIPGNDEGARSSLVIKTVTVFPKNPRRGLPMNQGALLAIDLETGAACGLLDTAAVTAIRTAAGSGVATDALARRDASTLAMLGTGVLGPTHIEAVCAVRTIDSIRIWGRTPAHAESLAGRVGAWSSAAVTVHDRSDDAVSKADIVCTATPSEEPLFDDASVRPGTHLNAVGAFRPSMCELPVAMIGRSRVFVDQLSAARVEAGDLIQADRAGRFAWDRLAGEIGDVLGGHVPGRTDDEQITLFKSVGMSLQDAAAAAVAMANAERDDIGHVIEWP